jgi:sphingomyelin phosphodiesterase
VYTQVLALADVAGQDGAYICAEFVNVSLRLNLILAGADSAQGYCDVPAANPLDVGRYITSKKPANAHAPKPSGERIRVLHVSDFHLDPRYATGSEANCSDYLCCRSYSSNTHSPNTTLAPAPRFGAYKCDTPYSLAGAALQAIPALAGPFDFGIFTGDLVSHDNDNQLSRAYTRYEEASVFGMLKHVLGGAALYPTLGNHDTWPQAFNAPLGYGPAEIQNEVRAAHAFAGRC